MNIRCLQCKGRHFCGRSYCPHYLKTQSMYKVKAHLSKEEFESASPAPFVGHFGYPRVHIGILAPPVDTEDVWMYDAPKYWSEKELQIPEIVDFRSSLINSRFNANVRVRNRFLEISQEVAMASSPADIEFSLDKKPQFRMQPHNSMAPTGPNARLKKATLTSNTRIHPKIEKVYNDTDLKATDAVTYLYEKGFDENVVSKILSVGTLGLKYNRRFVPTRWSISATDDILGKNLIKEVKEYDETGYLAFFSGYLGNYYLILMFPEIWSYELFETYMPKASWNMSDDVQYSTDFENYAGRTTYASHCAGGYYSVRLAVLEKLAKMRKQSSVLAIRIITGEYAVPLGVWVTREAARKSLHTKPIGFASKELMLGYAKNLLKTKFNYDTETIFKKSILLRNLGEQKKLSSFI